MKKNVFYNSMFRKLLWSYIALSVLPIVLIAVVVTTVIFNQVAQNAKQLNINILEQNKHVMDSSFNTLNSMAFQLNENDKIINFLYTRYENPQRQVLDTREVVRELVLLKANNPSIDNLAVYFMGHGIIIDNSFSYTPGEYYESYFSQSPLDFARWTRAINNAKYKTFISSMQVKRPPDEFEIITFCLPLLKTDVGGGAVLIANLRREELLATFETAAFSERWRFFAIDRTGTIVVNTPNPSSAPLKEFDIGLIEGREGEFRYRDGREDYIGIYSKSNASDLTYVYLVPKRSLSGDIGRINGIFSGLLLTALVLSGWLAYKNALKTYLPMEDMSLENELLTENLDRQLRLADDLVVRKLLWNEKLEPSDIARVEKLYFLQGPFVVAAADIGFGATRPDLDSSLRTWEAFESRLAGGPSYYRVSVSGEKRAYIIPQAVQDTFISFLQKGISALAEEHHKLTVCIGVGSGVLEVEQLHSSYGNAAFALAYARKKELGLVRFSDIDDSEISPLYFPYEKRLALQNHVRAGEAGAVEEILGEIGKANFSDRNLPGDVLRLLLIRLSVVLADATEDAAVRGTISKEELTVPTGQALSGDDAAEGFARLCDALLELSRQIAAGKKSSNTRLKNDILSYIQDNCHDPNLSLANLAERFQMNYTYLSMFFKENTGYTFVDFLNSCRLERARSLLKKPSLAIKDIALASGYISSNSFIKIFKKYYGITPGEFRRNLKKNQ